MTSDERLALIQAKVKRAEKHLRDLEVVRNRFIATNPYVILRERDPQTGDHIFKITDLQAPPAEISLIAGDVIHNIRSALDHLAYQLVYANGNIHTRQTAFPIGESATEYHAQRGRRVKGMAQSAIDAIDAAEPYKGGQGERLWAIHYLDIADKHHALLITLICMPRMVTQFSAHWVLNPGHRAPRFSLPNSRKPLKDGDVFFTCEPGLENETKVTFDVTFTEPEVVKGEPLFEFLKQATDLVDGLILGFKPLFSQQKVRYASRSSPLTVHFPLNAPGTPRSRPSGRAWVAARPVAARAWDSGGVLGTWA
jgi:hypothetical protein